MGQADGSVVIDTRMDTKGFKTGVADMQKGFNGLSASISKIGKIMAAVFSVRALVRFGKEAVQLGSDLQEVQNVVDVTFTTMSEKVNEFAKNAAETAGLSETMAKRYVGTFGAMSKSFGFTEDKAYEMSTALTQLAGDVASFYNITQDEAYTKLKSVFTGETETLKDLGVVMTQTALDDYALRKGLGKTTKQMSEQEKVALRYSFVLDQLSGASGDFVRTSDSWANQTRILKLQFDSLKATIGQGLINILTPVIKLINTLLGKLQTLANAFKSFTEMLTGKKAQAGSGYEQTSEDIQGIADATDNVAESTANAEKQQKKYLSGLDEIRTYDTGSDSESGSGAAFESAVDFGTVSEGNAQLENVNNTLDGVKEKFLELKDVISSGFWDGLGDYKPQIEGIKSDIVSIKDELIGIFSDQSVTASIGRLANSIASTLGKISGSLVSVGLTISQNLIGGIENYLSENSGRIKEYLSGMFDIGADIFTNIGNTSSALANILSAFGSETAQHVTGDILGIFSEIGMIISEKALNLGRDVLNFITLPIIENQDKIKESILGTLEAIEPFTSGLLDGIQKLRDSLSQLYDEHTKPFFDSLASGFSEICGKLLDGYNQYILPVVQGLGERFKSLMDGPFGETLSKIQEMLGKLTDALKLLWENVLSPMISWIADNIMPKLSPIIDFIGNTILTVFETIIDVIGNIADVLSGIIDFIVGIFTGDLEKALNGVVEIFTGICDAIVSVIKGIINVIIGIINGLISGVTSGINLVIRALNAISFDVPDWVPVLGGKTFGFNLSELSAPQIPYLATGAVIPPNAPFMAVLGDQRNGRNLEMPENLLRKIVREETGDGKGFNGTIRIPVILNGRTIFEAVIDEAKLRKIANGKNPFETV